MILGRCLTGRRNLACRRNLVSGGCLTCRRNLACRCNLVSGGCLTCRRHLTRWCTLTYGGGLTRRRTLTYGGGLTRRCNLTYGGRLTGGRNLPSRHLWISGRRRESSIEEALNLVRPGRHTQQRSLHHRAAHCLEGRQLLGGLDPIGDHRQRQVPAKDEDGLEQPVAVVLVL